MVSPQLRVQVVTAGNQQQDVQVIQTDDDVGLAWGNDKDFVIVLRTTILAANTALTDVLVGTPVTSAVAADSVIMSNVTASGDFLLALNRGGNSEEYIFADASAGTLRLVSPGGTLVIEAITGDITFETVAGNQILSYEMNTSETTTFRELLRIYPHSAGNMGDGFGGYINFSIEDNVSGVDSIVLLGARRNGADNTGIFAVQVASAGSFADRFTVDASGNAVLTGDLSLNSAGSLLNVGAAGNDFGASQLDLAANYTILGANGLTMQTTAGNLTLAPAGDLFLSPTGEVCIGSGC